MSNMKFLSVRLPKEDYDRLLAAAQKFNFDSVYELQRSVLYCFLQYLDQPVEVDDNEDKWGGLMKMFEGIETHVGCLADRKNYKLSDAVLFFKKDAKKLVPVRYHIYDNGDMTKTANADGLFRFLVSSIAPDVDVKIQHAAECMGMEGDYIEVVRKAVTDNIAKKKGKKIEAEIKTLFDDYAGAEAQDYLNASNRMINKTVNNE